jgi:peptidyl-prolyl cis-trans isomerase C
MKFKVLILVISATLVGCHSAPPEEPGLIEPDDVVLVLVDGEPITLPMLEFMMSARGVDEEDHEGMREILEELIRLRAVANAARSEGLDREPQVRANRMLRDLEALQLRYFDQIYRDHPVTDEDIEVVYQAQLERTGNLQYRIETILYPTQAEALERLVRIEDGVTTFDELKATAAATGLSVDSPIWVDRGQVPDEVAALMADVEAGEVLGLPLETPQGWRVVRVNDTREVEVPDIEEVREGIARHLVRQRLEALVEDLYDAAEIEPMLPLEEVTD